MKLLGFGSTRFVTLPVLPGAGGGDSKDTSEATSPFQLRLSQPQAGGAEFQRKQAALPAKAAPPLEKADSFGPNAVPK